MGEIQNSHKKTHDLKQSCGVEGTAEKKFPTKTFDIQKNDHQ